MRRENIESIIRVVIGISLLIVGMYIGNMLQKNNNVVSNDNVNIVLNYGNASENYSLQIMNRSLFEIMNDSMNLTYKMYGHMGAYILCINGVCQNNGKYWFYYINGKYANVGASSYYPKSNDNVSWILT